MKKYFGRNRGPVAQSVEQRTENPRVGSSILSGAKVTYFPTFLSSPIDQSPKNSFSSTFLQSSGLYNFLTGGFG